MDDLAALLRQAVDQQVDADVLSGTQTPGGAYKDCINKTAGGDLFYPGDRRVKEILLH